MRSKNTICAVALASMGILTAGSAFGQGSSAPATNPGRTADDTFAMHAASGGMAEVKLGELAEKNGSSEAVKNFGKRMVDDHSKANEQLKNVAAKNNITLPTTMDSSDRATYNRLSKLSGAEFDKAYMKDMVMDHEKDISEFKREANAGKNAEVKNFASDTLPTLESHLKEAKSVDKEVAGTTAGSASGPAQ